jgi:hypothetical protein
MLSKGPAMESKSKRTPIGLNLIAPGKWKQVSGRGLAPWPWICWIWSNGPLYKIQIILGKESSV